MPAHPDWLLTTNPQHRFPPFEIAKGGSAKRWHGATKKVGTPIPSRYFVSFVVHDFVYRLRCAILKTFGKPHSAITATSPDSSSGLCCVAGFSQPGYSRARRARKRPRAAPLAENHHSWLRWAKSKEICRNHHPIRHLDR